MTETERRAARAKRLRADETFQQVIQELRDEAIAAFLSSGAQDSAARDEAHAMTRAISSIEGKLSSWEAAQSLAEKKGQHRGTD
jgi:transcription elongation GreA/GreB family factor